MHFIWGPATFIVAHYLYIQQVHRSILKTSCIYNCMCCNMHLCLHLFLCLLWVCFSGEKWKGGSSRQVFWLMLVSFVFVYMYSYSIVNEFTLISVFAFFVFVYQLVFCCHAFLIGQSRFSRPRTIWYCITLGCYICICTRLELYLVGILRCVQLRH